MSPDTEYKLMVASAVVVFTLWLAIRIRRKLNRAKPPRIHPKLQKYQMSDDVAAQRRAEASKIVATSSTSEVAGFQIVRQIEAVFVDGFRRPEEAVEGLKAVAAMKGANGVTNVRHESVGMGKYSASGDAVVIEQTQANSPPESDTSKPG